MSPKVSVLMITYNHEKYIAQAIDSVLMQEVNFPIEIVIGEDFSVDDTRAICREYQKTYPEQISLLEHEKNLGMFENFHFTFRECGLQYLAVLEGDDYWINPNKLQEQADFLDNNQGNSLVFTRTEAFYQDENKSGYEIPLPDSKPYVLETLLRINFIANCSVMYRRELVNALPEWMHKLDMLDWPLHILYAQFGEIGFIDRVSARYRIHSDGQYSSRKAKENLKSTLGFYKVIKAHLGNEYRNLINGLRSEIYREIARLAHTEGKLIRSKKYNLFARLLSF